MMRVRLLSEQDFIKLCREEKRYMDYDERQFCELLREKGDFTDEESLTLLRHLHGEACVTGKWYRTVTADGRPCIPAISREAMYGLVVIENSRKGLYTPIKEDLSAFEGESRRGRTVGDDCVAPVVWKAFEELGMDILLTFRKKDFSFAWEIPVEGEFILEQYPVNGVPTDVHMTEEYLGEPELRDGQWYMHNSFYEDRYDWVKDTKMLLDVLHDSLMGETPLAKGIFSMEEFWAMCKQEISIGESPLRQMRYEQEEKAIGITREEELSPWKVVNHMDYLPEAGEARRLLYLIIEEYDDGRFCLRDMISVKYPSYEEMFCEAEEMKQPGCEVFVLPVDVNECMGCAQEIHRAVCAFRVTADVIETFGPKEGLLEFEKTLRRAVETGFSL